MSHAGPSIRFGLRASDFLKPLLVKIVGGAMVHGKRFVTVFALEKNRSIRLALKTIDCRL